MCDSYGGMTKCKATFPALCEHMEAAEDCAGAHVPNVICAANSIYVLSKLQKNGRQPSDLYKISGFLIFQFFAPLRFADFT